jgi:transmembrane sensor
MDRLETYQKVDTERAWKQVRQRLSDEGLIPAGSGHARNMAKPSLSRRIAYAASVMLIIAAAGAGYLLFDPWPRELLTLQTGPENNSLVQTLNDGSIVYLAGNSVLEYPKTFRGGQRRVSLSGEAFFDIRPKDDEPFVIETRMAIIEVMGTAFNLKSADDDFELIVEEGLVKVTLREYPEQSEFVGEWEMLTGLANRIEKSHVIDRTYLSWRINRMQFRDESLDNIASVISRNYNVKIDFDNPRIGENRLTVTFHNNEIKTIAEVIAFSFDLEYDILHSSSIIFREKK